MSTKDRLERLFPYRILLPHTVRLPMTAQAVVHRLREPAVFGMELLKIITVVAYQRLLVPSIFPTIPISLKIVE